LHGVIKSSSQIYCCRGRVALSKAYNYFQLGVITNGELEGAVDVQVVVLNLRTTTSKKCEEVPMRARI